MIRLSTCCARSLSFFISFQQHSLPIGPYFCSARTYSVQFCFVLYFVDSVVLFCLKEESESASRNATNSKRCNDHTIDMHREIESTHKNSSSGYTAQHKTALQWRWRQQCSNNNNNKNNNMILQKTHIVCKCDDLNRRDYSLALALTAREMIPQ